MHTSLGSDSDDEDWENPPPEVLVGKCLIAAKEVSEYYIIKMSRQEKEHIDSNPKGLLCWCSKNHQLFPNLSRVVRCILCIPASSSKSECNFSDAGNMLSDQRNAVSPATVNMMLFMRSNFNLKLKNDITIVTIHYLH